MTERAAAIPTSQSAAHPGPCSGLTVVVYWSGEVHSSRTFRSARTVTVGPRGTIVLPAEAVGDRESVEIAVATADSCFALPLNGACVLGEVRGGGERRSVGEIAGSDGTSGADGRPWPLVAEAEVWLTFGEFTIQLVPTAIGPRPWPMLWGPGATRWAVFLALATLLVGVPLIAAFAWSDADSRRPLSYLEQLELRYRELGLAVGVEPAVEPPACCPAYPRPGEVVFWPGCETGHGVPCITCDFCDPMHPPSAVEAILADAQVVSRYDERILGQPLRVAGGLSTVVVERVLRTRWAALARCIADGCIRTAGPSRHESAVPVKFVIDGNGKVVGAKVLLEPCSQSFETECLLQVVMQLRFPIARDGESTVVEFAISEGPIE